MQTQHSREWQNPSLLSANTVNELSTSKVVQIFALLYSEAVGALWSFQTQPDLQKSKQLRARHYYNILVNEYLNTVITENPILDPLIRYMPVLPSSIESDNWLELEYQNWYQEDIKIYHDKISVIKKPYKSKNTMALWADIQCLHEVLGLPSVLKHPERFHKATTGKIVIWKASKRVDYYPEGGAKRTANFNKGDRYKLFLMLIKSGGKVLSREYIMKRMGWTNDVSNTDKLGAAISYIRQSLSLNTRELILVNKGEVRYIGITEFQE